MNSLLLERLQIAAGFLPVDLQTATTGLRTGDWVSMRHYGQILILLFKDQGTAGDDVTLTIQQATSASGGSAKGLDFTTLHSKLATDLFTVGQWTKNTQSAGSTFTSDDSGENELMWAVEFDASELDVAGGFTFVRGSVNDVGTNAQLGCMIYILGNPRYAEAPTSNPSVLV